MLHDSTYTKYINSEIHWDRKKNGDFQGLEEGENKKLLLMDIEFQFCKMKSSVDCLHNNVNAFNTTEHWKFSKTVNIALCISP